MPESIVPVKNCSSATADILTPPARSRGDGRRRHTAPGPASRPGSATRAAPAAASRRGRTRCSSARSRPRRRPRRPRAGPDPGSTGAEPAARDRLVPGQHGGALPQHLAPGGGDVLGGARAAVEVPEPGLAAEQQQPVPQLGHGRRCRAGRPRGSPPCRGRRPPRSGSRPAGSPAGARRRRRSCRAAAPTAARRRRTGARSSPGRRRTCRSPTGPRAEAACTAASRSPTRSAPTKSAPRCPATVSPEPSNSRLFTTVVRTPAAASLSKAVRCGCHSRGSTAVLQSNAFSRSSVPGIRTGEAHHAVTARRQRGPERGQAGRRRRGHPDGGGLAEELVQERRLVGMVAQQLEPEAVDEEHHVVARLGQHQGAAAAVPRPPRAPRRPRAGRRPGTGRRRPGRRRSRSSGRCCRRRCARTARRRSRAGRRPPAGPRRRR